MDLTQFWQTIASAGEGATTTEQRTANLRDVLMRVDPAEIVAFDDHFATRRSELWEVKGLDDEAIKLRGMISDDTFSDFCSYVISRGEETFAAVLADPVTAVPALRDGAPEDDDFTAEGYAYVANEVHEEKTGYDIPLKGDIENASMEPKPIVHPITGEEFTGHPDHYPAWRSRQDAKAEAIARRLKQRDEAAGTLIGRIVETWSAAMEDRDRLDGIAKQRLFVRREPLRPDQLAAYWRALFLADTWQKVVGDQLTGDNAKTADGEAILADLQRAAATMASNEIYSEVWKDNPAAQFDTAIYREAAREFIRAVDELGDRKDSIRERLARRR